MLNTVLSVRIRVLLESFTRVTLAAMQHTCIENRQKPLRSPSLNR